MILHILVSHSDAKRCMSSRRVTFIGDSRIRQLFFAYARTTATNPKSVVEGKKVCEIYT